MYFTHKFTDSESHRNTVQANTIDMMEQFVLRNIRESFDTIGIDRPVDQDERVVARITEWVRANPNATITQVADLLSVIADEEIVL